MLPEPENNKSGWPWTEISEPSLGAIDSRTEWPKISIVTPSYNQGKFIEETIRSVLSQNYPNLEYIIIDGGSTEESVEIIKKYDEWIDYWVSEEDDGQGDAINKGFKQATGDIYAWLNSDDYYLPNALYTIANAFKKEDKDVGAIVGIGHKVNLQGEIIYTPKFSTPIYKSIFKWLNGEDFMQPACFFREKTWQNVGPLRTDLFCPMDVDLWLKIADKYKFKKINESLACAYEHAQAKTQAFISRMRAETALLFAEHGERDIAWKELQKMADDLTEAQQKIQKLKDLPVYGFVRPFYKKFIR